MTPLVRPARESDLPDIYMAGYDVWNDGQAKEDYIHDCLSSEKYSRGVWQVLETPTGKIASALICYKNYFGLAADCAGIGSVATEPGHRKKGNASLLVKTVADQLLREKNVRVFLYSDIPPAFYEKVGFRVLEDSLQKHKPSLCMVREAAQAPQPMVVPSYF